MLIESCSNVDIMCDALVNLMLKSSIMLIKIIKFTDNYTEVFFNKKFNGI